MSNDDKELLEAEPEKVIFASTSEELVAELNDRHPCDFAGLSYVWDDGYRVLVYPHPFVNGSAKKAAAAARVAGVVCVSSYGFTQSDFDDCVLARMKGVLTYNPKKAGALAKRRKLKSDLQHVTVSEICGVLGALEAITDPPFPRPGTYGASSRSCYVAFLVARLVIFNILFGRGAHRKFGPWQEFAGKWRLKREASEKAFLASGLDKFVEFMGRECDRRFRKPVEFNKVEVNEIRLP
jgi:hypothetical protein